MKKRQLDHRDTDEYQRPAKQQKKSSHSKKNASATEDVEMAEEQHHHHHHHHHSDEKEAFRGAWNALDSDDERLTIKAEKKFGRIKTIVAENADVKQSEQKLKEKVDSAKHKETATKVTDPAYKGPHLVEPLTLGFVNELLSAAKKNVLLHPDYASRIFTLARRHLKKHCSTINEVAIPKGGRVVVVGDTHGQLTDLLTIFKRAGMPSPTNVFVFNGDYVDRGPQEIEVLLTVLSLKIIDPGTVFLTRGNHEQRHLNERYSFEESVRTKYNPVMFELIQKVFKYLPLGSVIAEKVLVIHGGLFPFEDVTLQELKAIPRHNIGKGTQDTREDKIIQSLLWSDPQDESGWQKSSRGAGIKFGPDVSLQFLHTNKLELLIRSHEMVEEGFTYLHHNKVITLFSASNYCGTNENQGAVLLFQEGGELQKPGVIQYFAEAYIDESAAAETASPPTSPFSSKDSLCKEETLQKLRERIFTSRSKLAQAFSQVESSHDGYITVDEWGKCMHDTLGLKLKWDVLCPYLSKIDKETTLHKVNYSKFLDRYKIKVEGSFWDSWVASVVAKICDKILTTSSSLKKAFTDIDKNGDGKLSYKEFADVLQTYDLGLSPPQIYDLMHSIDANNDGHIDYAEFIARFEPTFTVRSTQQNVSPVTKAWIEQQLARIYTTLKHNHKDSLTQAFDAIDKDKSGHISLDELRAALATMHIAFTDDEFKTLVDHIDANKSNRISKSEFKAAIKPLPKSLGSRAGDKFYEGLLHTVCDAIHSSKTQLRSVFRQMDIDGSGKIDVEEFKAGLQALNVLLQVPLTDVQIKTLHSVIDKDKDGEISYEEFFESFSVVDKGAQ